MKLRPEWPAVVGDGDLVRLGSVSTPPEAEEVESAKGNRWWKARVEGKVEDEGVAGGASTWGAEGKLKKKPRSSNRTGLLSVGGIGAQGLGRVWGAIGSDPGAGRAWGYTHPGRGSLLSAAHGHVSLCSLPAPRGCAAGGAGQGHGAPCPQQRGLAPTQEDSFVLKQIQFINNENGTGIYLFMIAFKSPIRSYIHFSCQFAKNLLKVL